MGVWWGERRLEHWEFSGNKKEGEGKKGGVMGEKKEVPGSGSQQRPCL